MPPLAHQPNGVDGLTTSRGSLRSEMRNGRVAFPELTASRSLSRDRATLGYGE